MIKLFFCKVKKRLEGMVFKGLLLLDNDYGLNKLDRNEKIVVSMTSYPKRFPALYLAVRSILRQTMKPDKVVVYLDQGVTKDDLPLKLKDLRDIGVEFITKEEDLKPHKKYYYALQELSDCCVITIDDDMMYQKDLIKTLYDIHLKYPDTVVARRVSLMTASGNTINPYEQWHGEYTEMTSPSHELFATGVGGVLYPPKCFGKEAFDYDLIIKATPNADDVWLKYMEIINDKKVVYAPSKRVNPFSIKVDDGLYLKNVNGSENDIQIQKVAKKLEINLADYIKK